MWVSGNTRLSCSLTVWQHSVEPLSPTLIFPIFTACNVATIQNLMHIGAGTNIRWQNRSFRTNLSLFTTSVGLFTFVWCTGSLLVGGADIPPNPTELHRSHSHVTRLSNHSAPFLDVTYKREGAFGGRERHRIE